MSKKIKVTVAGTIQCAINQTLEMEEEDFKRLDLALDSECRATRRSAREEIEARVDFSDILDFDDLEIEGFEAIKEPS